MIRIIIAFIGLFLIWVLFFSGFSKDKKALIVAASLVLSMLGIWFESDFNKPKSSAVTNSDVSSCGVLASHSYRSSFDFELCFTNNASFGDITRIGFTLIALNCEKPSACVEVQRVERDLNFDLPMNTSGKLTQNLSFSNVPVSLENTQWSLKVNSVKAAK